MSAAAAHFPSPLELVAGPPLAVVPDADLEVGGRVRTLAGALGTIIGFYRTESPTVLVRLDEGSQHQFLPGVLRRLG
jgi:hypothetical protein